MVTETKRKENLHASSLAGANNTPPQKLFMLRSIYNRLGNGQILLQDNGGSCTVRSFIICTHPQILLGR
jgi:hypothetical protein